MDTEKLLALPEVLETCLLPKATLYRRIEAGAFPRPRQVTRKRVGWLQSEIAEWMHALPESRRTAQESA